MTELCNEQKEALRFLVDRVAEVLASDSETGVILGLLGQAGSGKSTLLKPLVETLKDELAEVPAIATPSHKAAARLRETGLPAQTLHSRFLATVWQPWKGGFEAFLRGKSGDTGWLDEAVKDIGETKPRLNAEGIVHARKLAKKGGLTKALEYLQVDEMRDLLVGWSPRESQVSVAIIDEAGMASITDLQKMREQARVLILVGDPAQLYPVADQKTRRADPNSARSALEALTVDDTRMLREVHRTGEGSAILTLAQAVTRERLPFYKLMELARSLAAEGDEIVVSDHVDSAWLREVKAPVLVYTNERRIEWTDNLRSFYGYPANAPGVGEQLIVEFARDYDELRDDPEIPPSRIAGAPVAHGVVKAGSAVDHFLQATGAREAVRPDMTKERLTRNAVVTVIEHDSRKRPGWTVVRDVFGKDHAIRVKLQHRFGEPPLCDAGRGSITFRSAVAMTTHKMQGSEADNIVVDTRDFANVIRSPAIEGHLEVWRRLFYTAITRAQKRVVLITD